MDATKIKEVTGRYRKRLIEMDYDVPICNNAAKTAGERWSHCHWMLNEIELLVDAGDLPRAHVWLGFVQGTFWADHVYTIADMRNHNRPEKA